MRKFYLKRLAKTSAFKSSLVLFVLTIFLQGMALAQAPADENYDDNLSFSVSSSDFSLDGVRYQITGSNSYTHATSNQTFNLSEGGVVIMHFNLIKIVLAEYLA